MTKEEEKVYKPVRECGRNHGRREGKGGMRGGRGGRGGRGLDLQNV